MSLRNTNNSLAAGFCRWIHDCPLWQQVPSQKFLLLLRTMFGSPSHLTSVPDVPSFAVLAAPPWSRPLNKRSSRTNYIYNERSGSLKRGWGRSHDVRLHSQALDLAASSLGFPPISATSIGSVNQLQGRPNFVVPSLCQLFRRRYRPLLLRPERLKSQNGVWTILAVGWRPF